MFPRNAFLVIVAIPAFAIAYYFAIALPANETAKLEFEKQKYSEQKAEEAELKRQPDETSANLREEFDSCVAIAEKGYHNASLAASTTRGEGQPVLVPLSVAQALQRERDSKLAECHRRFDK